MKRYKTKFFRIIPHLIPHFLIGISFYINFLSYAPQPLSAMSDIPHDELRKLKQYSIDINYMANVYFFHEFIFCDKYNWTLDTSNNYTGVYFIINKEQKQRVSKISYKTAFPLDNSYGKLKITLKTDLLTRMVKVYINNQFCKTVFLNLADEDLNLKIHSAFKLGKGDSAIKKLKIYDAQGKVYYKYPLSSGKMLRRAKKIGVSFFISGIVLVLLAVLFSKRVIFKFFHIIVVLFFLEAFLKTTEGNNPFLNMSLLVRKPIWDIEKITNLFGTYDDRASMEVYVPTGRGEKYFFKKSEDVVRIICLGTSSTQGSSVPRNKAYPAILEQKLNSAQSKKRYEVINTGMGGHEAFRISIYFKEVLLKLNPDIVTVYLGENDRCGRYGKFFLEYKRAKELLSRNSAWIKNQRLLFLALDFRFPIRELVCLYDFLCESYVFMAVNNLRKMIFKKIYNFLDIKQAYYSMNKNLAEESLQKIINICEGKDIKVVLIPEIKWADGNIGFCWIKYQKLMKRISQRYKSIYYLDIRNVFRNNSHFILFYDNIHPLEYGHSLIAQEIYAKIVDENLI